MNNNDDNNGDNNKFTVSEYYYYARVRFMDIERCTRAVKRGKKLCRILPIYRAKNVLRAAGVDRVVKNTYPVLIRNKIVHTLPLNARYNVPRRKEIMMSLRGTDFFFT